MSINFEHAILLLSICCNVCPLSTLCFVESLNNWNQKPTKLQQAQLFAFVITRPTFFGWYVFSFFLTFCHRKLFLNKKITFRSRVTIHIDYLRMYQFDGLGPCLVENCPPSILKCDHCDLKAKTREHMFIHKGKVSTKFTRLRQAAA